MLKQLDHVHRFVGNFCGGGRKWMDSSSLKNLKKRRIEWLHRALLKLFFARIHSECVCPSASHWTSFFVFMKHRMQFRQKFETSNHLFFCLFIPHHFEQRFAVAKVNTLKWKRRKMDFNIIVRRRFQLSTVFMFVTTMTRFFSFW